jgi:uncharacterized protein
MRLPTLMATSFWAACALAQGALAQDLLDPSFDCTKASTAAEKVICDAPELYWYDRQMAKAYAIARKTGKDGLIESQRAFLKERDACAPGKNAYDCIVGAYERRIEALAQQSGLPDFYAGSYAGDFGEMSVVRYPDGKAAFTVSTVGGGDHTCGFDTEDGIAKQSGVITWSANPDAEIYKEDCTLTLTPSRSKNSSGITLQSQGEACQYYCGVRASLNGEFTRVKH